MKPKTSGLKLFVKPEKVHGNVYLEFVWVTEDEIKYYKDFGYVRFRDYKGDGNETFGKCFGCNKSECIHRKENPS